jgi:DNA (cytosine-5)-methyltransferase 1
MTSETKPTAISLFTGAGGLDYGFEAAGFQTSVALEFDERCIQTLRANRPWPLIVEDIAGVSTARVLEEAHLEPGEADVLIGGPPCQPFSKSGFWVTGEAGRLNDPRAATLVAYLRVLEEARPRTFLLENVEGLGFKGKDEGLRLLRAELDRINQRQGTAYKSFVRVLNAADFGVPQMRRRMFVIGDRDGRAFQFPKPTHKPATSELALAVDDLEPHRTAWDALMIYRSHKLLLSGCAASGLGCCQQYQKGKIICGIPSAAEESRFSDGADVLVLPAQAREGLPFMDDPGPAWASYWALPLE